MKHITSWAALALCALTLVSCDPPAGPPAASIVGVPGTTLEVERYSLDMFGTRDPRPGSSQWMTLLSDVSPYAGMPHVARIVTRTDTSRTTAGDTTYMHVLENGDIALLQRFITTDQLGIERRWISFPTGTKGSRVTVSVDTAFTRGGQTYRFKEVTTTRFLGSEVIRPGTIVSATSGDPLATVKAQVVQVVEETQGLHLPTPIETTTTIWFSPKLGMIVREETVVTFPAPGGTGRAGNGIGFSIIEVVK